MDIQLFNSPQFGDVRMSSDEKGNPLFLATDVAKALGYSNPRDAVAKHCKPDGVAICDVIDSIGRTQQARFINEGNLYRLIARSNLPEAEKFESWIFDEVVPQIRKNGGYIQARPEDTPEEIMAKAVLLAQNTIEQQKQKLQMLEGKNQFLEEENRKLAPKAEYTERVLQSTGNSTFTECAKELNMRSGEALIKKLLDRKIIFKQGKRYLPLAKYSDKGYFDSRTHHFFHADGRPDTSKITVVTERGRMWLHEMFNVALKPIEIDSKTLEVKLF